ncbi:MAG: hypothetical protein KIT84_36600 [Labilithrix sp.]|nr:hypothetical protein [Labilithrix sp.]MCW5816577.1 hypothetical protein [Labilithrix sp.]
MCGVARGEHLPVSEERERTMKLRSALFGVVAASVLVLGCEGPMGPAGPPGPAGGEGTQGAQGPQGEPGTAGARGETGAQGAQGAQGPSGPTGGIASIVFCESSITVATNLSLYYTYQRTVFQSGDVFAVGSLVENDATAFYAHSYSKWFKAGASNVGTSIIFIDSDNIGALNDNGYFTIGWNAAANAPTIFAYASLSTPTPEVVTRTSDDCAQ